MVCAHRRRSANDQLQSITATMDPLWAYRLVMVVFCIAESPRQEVSAGYVQILFWLEHAGKLVFSHV